MGKEGASVYHELGLPNADELQAKADKKIRQKLKPTFEEIVTLIEELDCASFAQGSAVARGLVTFKESCTEVDEIITTLLEKIQAYGCTHEI